MQTLARIVILSVVLCRPCHADAVAPAAGTYRVVSAASSVHVLVYRGGMLGRLGHNHVISVTGLSGRVTLPDDPLQTTVEIDLPVAGLDVDDPAARAAEGSEFPGTVPETDRSGTRRNMLGPKLLKVTDDASFRLRATRIEGTWPEMIVTLGVEIRGKPCELRLPVTIETAGHRLVAAGEQQFRHEDLGLRPFSAAFGALRVRDEFTLRYNIVAERGLQGNQSASSGKRALPVVDHDAAPLRDAATE